MSQENFDDLLKQSFDKERDIPFDESGWQALEAKLPTDSKKYPLPLWLLGLLGAGWLLAAALILLWPKSGQSDLTDTTTLNDIAENEPITKLTNSLDNTITDTVYLTQIQIVRDTFIQYLATTKTAPPSLPDAISQIATNPLNDENNLWKSKLSDYTPTIESEPLAVDKTQSTTSPKLPSYEALPANLLPDIRLLEYERPMEYSGLPAIRKTINRSKAHRFHIGLTGGWAAVNYNSLKSELRLFDGSRDISLENAEDEAADSSQLVPVGIRQYGIQVGYRLNRFLSLQAEVGRESVSHLNSNPLGNDFKQADIYSARYNNSDVFLSQNGMYYEIGLQGRTQKRLSPVFNTSLRMRSHLTRRIDGTTNNQSGVSIPVEFQSDFSLASNSLSPNQRKAFKLEQLKIGGGLGYRINPQWEIQATADYYAPLRYDSWLQAQWGVNLALRYSL